MIDRESELFEHLQELRTRLIRSVVFLIIGFAIAWFLYDWVYGMLIAPLETAVKNAGGELNMMFTRVTEPFMIHCQVSAVVGAILASPAVTYQVWGFIAPALSKEERKPLRWVVPLCILLFAFGVAVGYLILPQAMKYFVSFVPKNGAELRPVVGDNLVFIVKMLLAFGLVFELPMVLLFLGKLGVVTSEMLKSGWRHAMVGISVLAAVATPSNDAISMLSMAVPLCGLYFISIFLVKMVEPKPLP